MRRLPLVLSILSFALPFAVHAASAGDLVKISGNSAVYYIGSDQERHAFPNEKIYHSWYADFSGVQTISANELAAFTLGANVFYRPGVRMVKVTTDPKVYAVDHDGVLRWVTTEAVAGQLYGSYWNTQIDDLPDAFFSGYQIGANVASASGFNAATATANNPTIDANQFKATAPPPPPVGGTTSTPPTATSTAPSYSLSLSTSKSMPHPGDSVDLFGTVNPTTGLSSVMLDVNGTTVTNCGYSPCGESFIIPRSGTQPSYDVSAVARWIDGHEETASTTLMVATSTSGDITVAITHPEVEPNGITEIVATADSNFIAHDIDIYVDGNDIRGCTSTQQCRYSGTETAPAGTVHTIYAIATDTNGQTIRSDTQTYAVVMNDHPEITVTPGKNFMYTGETVDVTVSANDVEGISWTEIWLDGRLLQHCAAASCTTTAGPWSQARSVYFIGKAQDADGLQNQATSSAVIVQ